MRLSKIAAFVRQNRAELLIYDDLHEKINSVVWDYSAISLMNNIMILKKDVDAVTFYNIPLLVQVYFDGYDYCFLDVLQECKLGWRNTLHAFVDHTSIKQLNERVIYAKIENEMSKRKIVYI